MFTPYFDCSRSGQNNGITVVVSGWLASGEQWVGFEHDWREVLARFNVPYFHIKEFAHSTRAFADGWKGEDDKRKAFIESLLAVIDQHTLAGFACTVESRTFEEVNKEYQVREYFGTAYALCACICAAEVDGWIREHGYELPVEYVFGDGDPRGRLSGLMESQGYPPPIYKPSRDRVAKDGTIIRGLLPLQAADFAAYELRKGWDDLGDTEEIWRYRQSFLGIGQFAKCEGYWGLCSPYNLRQMCHDLGVTRRASYEHLGLSRGRGRAFRPLGSSGSHLTSDAITAFMIDKTIYDMDDDELEGFIKQQEHVLKDAVQLQQERRAKKERDK